MFSAVIIIILFHTYCLTNALKDLYTWNEQKSYYYDSIQEKINEIALSYNCKKSIKFIDNHTEVLPAYDDEIHVSVFPISHDILWWWKNIPRPNQMRVDPFLCESVYKKKRPIFKNNGCQLPHYMHPSAPRCQISYLKWICDKSKLFDSDPRHFFLPESNHNQSFIPPIPYLLITKNSLVSMCGTVVFKCGTIHTTANCMATGYEFQALKFQRSCKFQQNKSNQVCLECNLYKHFILLKKNEFI